MNSAATARVLRAKVISWARGGAGVFRNKRADRNLIMRILVYSAMKIRANVPLLNSVLNPDTSSDSPSAKSNGVRLVSARVEINHVTLRGGMRMISGRGIQEDRCEKSNVKGRSRVVIRINLILTS